MDKLTLKTKCIFLKTISNNLFFCIIRIIANLLRTNMSVMFTVCMLYVLHFVIFLLYMYSVVKHGITIHLKTTRVIARITSFKEYG